MNSWLCLRKTTRRNVMKYSRKLLRSLFLIIPFCAVSTNELKAQSVHQYSFIYSYQGAEELQRSGIDTTNLARIRQIADSCDHPLNDYACLFFAQHGATDITSQVENCFYRGFQRPDWYKEFHLLAVLITLKGESAYPYATALLDSMIIQKREFRGRFTSDEFARVIEVLLDYKDYTSVLSQKYFDKVAQS
jgi:hypothetical protein